jgi:hypothetical protein
MQGSSLENAVFHNDLNGLVFVSVLSIDDEVGEAVISPSINEANNPYLSKPSPSEFPVLIARC